MNNLIVKDGEEMVLAQEVVDYIYNTEVQMKEIKSKYDEYKQALLEAMDEYGIKKISNEKFTISNIAPHLTTRVDSKKLQTEYPEIYDECSKASLVKSSIKIKLK